MPDWIARAFGSQDAKKQDKAKPKKPKPTRELRAVELRAACRRARAFGKPLLVFVVPGKDDAASDRGEVLGALLNHGKREFLLDLAMCELACGTAEEVRVATGVEPAVRDPLMLLIEFPKDSTRPKKPTLAPIVMKLDPGHGLWHQWDSDKTSYEEFEAGEKKHAHRNNTKMAAAVRKLLVPDAGALITRADRVRAKLGKDDRAAVEAFLAKKGTLPLTLALQAAAILRMAARAPRHEGDAKRLLDTVAGAVGKRYVQDRVMGARWANSSGCSLSIEDDPMAGFAGSCGMGHVPVLSQRFLMFYDL